MNIDNMDEGTGDEPIVTVSGRLNKQPTPNHISKNVK